MDGTKQYDSPWVLINLRDQVFAIQSKSVQGMLALPATLQLPGAPPYIRGLIDVRGRSLALVDLGLRLELENRDENRALGAGEIAVVVEGARGNFAVAVDSVISVEMLKEGSYEDLPEASVDMKENELISGIAKREREEDIVLLLDPLDIIKTETPIVEEETLPAPPSESMKVPETVTV